MPDPIDPSEWQLDPRSLELIHRATGARESITDAHVDALLGFEPGTTEAMIRQYNSIVGSPLGLGERVSELLRRTELPGVVDIGASLAEDLVKRGPVERAAELTGARGVGWTRMERILRALIANVGVEAPAPAAGEAPTSGPADVEALWTGQMGRAGGRAGWTLAREALSLVQSAGLGALSEARAAQLAGALLGLLDKGTLDHAALVGAVGRLIRQWMEQGEPRPEEPRPEEPRPEEQGEDPFPEGEPLPPETFPDGARYDILVICYDVFTQTFRLALLLADAVWDRPGVVPDAGVVPTRTEVENERTHVQKRGVLSEATKTCRDFSTPALPNSETIFSVIMTRFDLDTLFILNLSSAVVNPSYVEATNSYKNNDWEKGLQRFRLEHRSNELHTMNGALGLRGVFATGTSSQRRGVSDFGEWLSVDKRRTRYVLGRWRGGDSMQLLKTEGADHIKNNRGVSVEVRGEFPDEPSQDVENTLSWFQAQRVTLGFGRRQRMGRATHTAKYNHGTFVDDVGCVGDVHKRVDAGPRSTAGIEGGVTIRRGVDKQYGFDPTYLLEQGVQRTAIDATSVTTNKDPPRVASGEPAAITSWLASTSVAQMGASTNGSKTLGLALPGMGGVRLDFTPESADSVTDDETIGLVAPGSTFDEDPADASGPGSAAGCSEHKVSWITVSEGSLTASQVGDVSDIHCIDWSAKAEFRVDVAPIKHVTNMGINKGQRGYVLELQDPDAAPAWVASAWVQSLLSEPEPGRYRKVLEASRKVNLNAGTITVLPPGRTWTVEHRAVQEWLKVVDQQYCRQVIVETIRDKLWGPEHRVRTVTADPKGPVGDFTTERTYVRTALGLFIRK